MVRRGSEARPISWTPTLAHLDSGGKARVRVPSLPSLERAANRQIRLSVQARSYRPVAQSWPRYLGTNCLLMAISRMSLCSVARAKRFTISTRHVGADARRVGDGHICELVEREAAATASLHLSSDIRLPPQLTHLAGPQSGDQAEMSRLTCRAPVPSRRITQTSVDLANVTHFPSGENEPAHTTVGAG
jgi:hypothetical protein